MLGMLLVGKVSLIFFLHLLIIPLFWVLKVGIFVSLLLVEHVDEHVVLISVVVALLPLLMYAHTLQFLSLI